MLLISRGLRNVAEVSNHERILREDVCVRRCRCAVDRLGLGIVAEKVELRHLVSRPMLAVSIHLLALSDVMGVSTHQQIAVEGIVVTTRG